MNILSHYDVSACTDVTGFGLLGHLAEMCRASKRGATISLNAVPLLPDVELVFERGIQSTLQVNNEQALVDWRQREPLNENLVKSLVDPQTSGGLLAAVRPDQASECRAELKKAGYSHASVIGNLTEESHILQIIP